VIQSLSSRQKKYSQKSNYYQIKLNQTFQIRLLLFLISLVVWGVVYFFASNIIFYTFPIILISIFPFLLNRSFRIESFVNQISQVEKNILLLIQRINKNFDNIPYNDYQFGETSIDFLLKDLNLNGKRGILHWIDVCATRRGRRKWLDNIIKNKSLSDIRNNQSEISSNSENIHRNLRYLIWNDKTKLFSLSSIYKQRVDDNFLVFVTKIYYVVPIFLLISYFLFPLIFGIFLTLQLFLYYKGNLKVRLLIQSWKNQGSLGHFDWKQIKLANLSKIKTKDLNQIMKKFQEIDSIIELFISPGLRAFLGIFFLYEYKLIKKFSEWDNNQFGNVLEKLMLERVQLDSQMPYLFLKMIYPDWIFPKIVSSDQSIEADSIGHMFINPNNMIQNSLPKISPGSVFVISGSNMAGKTTYLKSIGTCIILGLSGCPLPHKNLQIPNIKVFSNIYNEDNISESISFFYSEVLRMKEILSKAENGDVILLDEILKGTNSLDRSQATKEILQVMKNKKLRVIITTHDLSLCDVPFVENYHFSEKIENNEMIFDYILKKGKVNSTNAIWLLKKEGVIP
jgi:hypothetical protein